MSVLGARGEQLVRVGHEILVFIPHVFFSFFKDRPQISELRYNAGMSPMHKEEVDEVKKQILTHLAQRGRTSIGLTTRSIRMRRTAIAIR